MNHDDVIDKMTKDLHSLGVRQGGVLLVHSSLSSLGFVHGGAETVIRGLLDALGAEGTLLMPALGSGRNGNGPLVFDVRRTPTWTGRIAEAFRLRPGTRRSVHPTHSVCGVGRLSSDILAGHEEDTTPCGPNSPFHRLRNYRGHILMLGCGLKPNTSFHAIEELVEPPYLFGESIDCTLRLADGREIVKKYRMHGFDGWEQRYDRIRPLMARKEQALVHGKVLAANAYLVDAATMWETALSAMRSDPLFFVEKT